MFETCPVPFCIQWHDWLLANLLSKEQTVRLVDKHCFFGSIIDGIEQTILCLVPLQTNPLRYYWWKHPALRMPQRLVWPHQIVWGILSAGFFSSTVSWDIFPETNELHLKMDGWKTIISFWGKRPIFRGKLAVSFTECIPLLSSASWPLQLKVADLSPIHFRKLSATDGTYKSKYWWNQGLAGFGGLIQGQIYNPAV